MIKVFIDGKEGTTGLQLYDRLKNRTEIDLLSLSDELRKNTAARSEMLNSCDFAFLCLPDAAAIEAVSLVKNSSTKIIDASTAHRTAGGWTYGFPELSDNHRKGVVYGNRVAVPGCHASGFIAAAYPLISSGIIDSTYPFVITSITGYSGGGKGMIAEYERGGNTELDAPRQYATGQAHKHLKEMVGIAGLTRTPVFEPYVSPFYSGMQVTTPIFADMLQKPMSLTDTYEFYNRYYSGQKLVSVELAANGLIASNALSKKDGMRLVITGNDDRILVVALYDNLGKGASGAAVQCFNLMAGFEETAGLIL